MQARQTPPADAPTASTTLTPEALAEYLYLEYASGRDSHRADELLSLAGQAAEGIVLANLRLRAQTEREATFRFRHNLTRFKLGDGVVLTDGTERFLAHIVGLAPRQLTLREGYGTRFGALHPEANWRLEGVPFDLGLRLRPVVREALAEGQRGRAWLDLLNASPLRPPAPAPLPEATGAVGEALSSLNDTQRRAVATTLAAPPLFAVQGPPGTGKTRVLALAAALLAAAGRQVAVVAHTHHAANHALAEIQALGAATAKVGDPLKGEGLPVRTYRARFKQFQRDWLTQVVPGAVVAGFSYYGALFTLARGEPAYRPDVVLVDEASQLPLSLGALAGLFGASSVVLFGDQQQMPPIFRADLADHPLSVSLLRRVAERHPACLLPLDTTYRLNEALTRIVGKLFYRDADGEVFLKPGAGNAARRFRAVATRECDPVLRRALHPAYPFVWVRAQGQFCRQVNQPEAALIARLVGTCLEAGFALADLAVIAPFRRQIVAIQQALAAAYPQQKEWPVVDTVERVQGQSVEMVVVGYTTTDPDYVAEVADFLYAPERLNVAISRAKTKVIFVCSNSVLEAVPHGYAAWRARQTLRDLKQLANVVI